MSDNKLVGPTLRLSVALSAADVQALMEWGAAIRAAERERCKAAVQYSQVRCGYHNDEHGRNVGHFNIRMLEWIDSGFDVRKAIASAEQIDKTN